MGNLCQEGAVFPGRSGQTYPEMGNLCQEGAVFPGRSGQTYPEVGNTCQGVLHFPVGVAKCHPEMGKTCHFQDLGKHKNNGWEMLHRAISKVREFPHR